MAKPLDPLEIVRAVGLRIGEAREHHGLTQAELAERLGIALRNLQRIERGEQNLTIQTIVKVANALGVPPSEFWKAPTRPPAKRGRPKVARAR